MFKEQERKIVSDHLSWSKSIFPSGLLRPTHGVWDLEWLRWWMIWLNYLLCTFSLLCVGKLFHSFSFSAKSLANSLYNNHFLGHQCTLLLSSLILSFLPLHTPASCLEPPSSFSNSECQRAWLLSIKISTERYILTIRSHAFEISEK